MHLQDFSEAADALGSLNLSEGWSSLSLRSRHSESGAQDAELRAQRGDPFEDNRSHRDAGQEEEGDQYGSAQSVSQLASQRPPKVSVAPLLTYTIWMYTHKDHFGAFLWMMLLTGLSQVMLCCVVVCSSSHRQHVRAGQLRYLLSLFCNVLLVLVWLLLLLLHVVRPLRVSQSFAMLT